MRQPREALWRYRVRRLEAELRRTRHSRRVLMDLLVRLDSQWKAALAHLESENRRLWERARGQGV